MAKISLEKARAVAMPAARPALSAICVRHLLRSKMPTGKEVGVGTQSYSFGLRGAYKSVTGGGAYRCRHVHTVEANDEGPSLMPLMMVAPGPLGSSTGLWKTPLVQNESMD